MSHLDAIVECRLAFADAAPAWPAPLIRFLDQPPDMRRVFGYVVRCVRRLLDLLGERTLELDEQVTLFERYVATTPDLLTVRQTLEQLWVLRSPHETAKTAVVQLFASLLRYREADEYRHLSCTTSIAMLVEAAPDPEQALAQVILEFEPFVGEDTG
jgi:hypothetical protein